MYRETEDLCSGFLWSRWGGHIFLPSAPSGCLFLHKARSVGSFSPSAWELWSHDLTLDDREEKKWSTECWGQRKWCYCSVPVASQNHDPLAAAALPAQAAPVPQLQRSATRFLPSIGFGCLPEFPSGMRLEGGKWQFLTLHISAQTEWSFSGVKPQRLSTSVTRGLPAHQTPPARHGPNASVVKGKDRGQLCEGTCYKAWKKYFIEHPPMVHAREIKKNLDINVLESLESLN